MAQKLSKNLKMTNSFANDNVERIQINSDRLPDSVGLSIQEQQNQQPFIGTVKGTGFNGKLPVR